MHIITGESGVGKTTLLTQWINILADGGEIMGLPVEPQKVLYVSNERSQESLEIDNENRWHLKAPFMTIARAFEGLGIDDKDKWTPKGLEAIIRKFSGQYDVLVVDPIVTFCPKPNDQNHVHRFLYELAQNTLKSYKTTILASGHPPKEREGGKIMNIRQKVAGSHGWGSFSNCNMHLELADDDNRMSSRVRLEVRGRHSPPMEFYFDRDKESGKLIEVPDPKVAGITFVLDNFLESRAGQKLSTKEMVEYGEAQNVSRATVERWIKKKEVEGWVLREGRGEWIVKEPNETVDSPNRAA